MNRRSALAAAAALSLSITGLAAAAGATMHVFDAAEASPNVGKISPVSTTTTAPPEIERHVVTVEDPAVPPAAPGASTEARESTAGHENSEPAHVDRQAAANPGPTPAAATPAATGSTPDDSSGHEFGDD